MRLPSPLAHARDACAQSGNTLTLHVGVCVALEFAESHEQVAGIGRSLLHRLGQPQRRSGAGWFILLRCNVGRSTVGAALPIGGRSLCLTSPNGAVTIANFGVPGTASTAA